MDLTVLRQQTASSMKVSSNLWETMTAMDLLKFLWQPDGFGKVTATFSNKQQLQVVVVWTSRQIAGTKDQSLAIPTSIDLKQLEIKSEQQQPRAAAIPGFRISA